MKRRRFKPYVLEGICALVVLALALSSYLFTQSLLVATDKIEKDYMYVSNEVLSDNIIPVIGDNNSDDKTLLRPYNESDITVGKSFYDYQASDDKSQEDAIIYYENTYIKNTGVDYVKKTPFKVISILEGEVISVTEDDIVGKTIKIRHNNGMISVYQSLSETVVNEKDQVSRGQEIGTSGENTINSNLGNHLHFELYYNNKLVNPEKYLGKRLGEF